MASLIFNSFWDDKDRGNIVPSVDTFYVMLCTSGYTPDKDAHLKRSDVTNEVAAGNGYTAGGQACAVTITKDTATDKQILTLAAVDWTNATITARKAVYYKRRGGAATADEVVCVAESAGDIISTNGTFSLGATTINLQN